jgi:hypothetical protein
MVRNQIPQPSLDGKSSTVGPIPTGSSIETTHLTGLSGGLDGSVLLGEGRSAVPG